MPASLITLARAAAKSAKTSVTALAVVSLTMAAAGCSKRDPKIDVAVPGVRAPTTSSTGGGGGSGRTPYVPPPGRQPSIPDPGRQPIAPPNNPPVNPGRQPIAPPYNPPSTPIRPGGGGGVPIQPMVNPLTPDRSATQISIPMQVVMTNDGPKVGMALPAGATNVKLQYLKVAGMVEGTTVDVSLAFTSGAKACSIESVTVRTEATSVAVPCK